MNVTAANREETNSKDLVVGAFDARTFRNINEAVGLQQINATTVGACFGMK